MRLSTEPVRAVLDPPAGGEPECGRIRHLLADGERVAEHDGCAALVAHDDAGLVGLATFAVPSFDELEAGWVGQGGARRFRGLRGAPSARACSPAGTRSWGMRRTAAVSASRREGPPAPRVAYM